jgi:hypothetical protein
MACHATSVTVLTRDPDREDLARDVERAVDRPRDVERVEDAARDMAVERGVVGLPRGVPGLLRGVPGLPRGVVAASERGLFWAPDRGERGVSCARRGVFKIPERGVSAAWWLPFAAEFERSFVSEVTFRRGSFGTKTACEPGNVLITIASLLSDFWLGGFWLEGASAFRLGASLGVLGVCSPPLGVCCPPLGVCCPPLGVCCPPLGVRGVRGFLGGFPLS